MKQRSPIAVTLCTLLVAAWPSFAASAQDDEVLLDRIAAIVNGEVVTLSEALEMALPVLSRLPDGIDREAAQLETLSSALDALIDERLLRQEAAAREIFISEAEIDRAVIEVRRQHGLSEAEFRQAIASQGFSWEDYRRELAAQLERYRLLGAEVQARVEVTDEDVRSYLSRQGAGRPIEEARVRHILIRVPEGSSDEEISEKRERAEEVLARLREGEDFSLVAMDVSEDPSARSGGELGWLRKGRMVRSLEEAVFGANEGELVGPVRSPSGWHLIEVSERRVRRTEQDEFMEQRARQALMEEALDRETRRFIEGLRRRAVIEIRL